MSVEIQIQQFLSGGPHAIVGASRHREKYGNKVLRAFLQNGRQVYPVNPAADLVEGYLAYPDLGSVPQPVYGVSLITPPEVSERVVDEAVRLGIAHIWFQPGAESETAVDRAKQAGMNVIYGGPCVLVTLHYRER